MIESSEKSSLKRKPETSKNVQSKQEMIKVKEAPPAPSTSQSNSNASANMDWEKYLELRAGQPAVDGHLFQHQHFVERTLGEHIFRPGRLVHVHHKLDGNKAEQMLKGRIQITIKNEAIIEINWMGKVKKPKMITSDNGFHFCSMEKVENEESTNNIPPTSLPYKNFFPISELELLPLEIEGTEEEKFEDAKMMSAEEWKSIDKEYSNFLANHRNWLSRPLHYFIEIGQLFELHDAKNANLVHLVRIVKCKFGMILAEFGTKNQQKEWIHICDERCHPFGWTERQNSKFAAFNHQIFPRYKLQNAFSNILPKSISMVPNWLFTFRPIQEHKFEVGMILEMLDPLNRLTFVPAFVSEICNQHYFKVRSIRNVSTVDAKNEEYLCHRCSPELLPLGWCFKNQIRLVFPEGMKGGADSNSFSYSALRNRLKELMEKPAEENAKISFKFAPDALFDLPKMMAKKLDCIRYCEVQNASSVSPLIYQHSPSAILRSHRHFIWVHSESSKGPYNLPKIYSIFPSNFSSLHLFRNGSANEFPNSLISAMPIKIPTELALERRHFDETYNSDESSSAILPNPKAFMPKIWMDDDRWLPKIHLNIGCFSGPFLCKTKLASLPFHFGPGPLPHLLNEIFKNIILCANRPKEMAEMLKIVNENANNHSQLMLVQLKHKERRIMANVEICNQAKQFPAWLAMLLIRLDACPNLFSLEKLAECECSNSMAKLAYFQSSGHPQMINSTTSKCLLNKFLADIKQINREMTNKQRKKEEEEEGNGQKRRINRITVYESSGMRTRLMKTRANTKQRAERLEQNAPPHLIPEEEWSQESQCSTATTQSSSQTSTQNSALNANEQMERGEEEEDEERIKTPPPLLSRKKRWIKLGAKLPIVKPKNAALLEEANKMMGIRIGEVCSNELPNSLPNEAKCSSTNIGGGGGMDRRVGTVPPNNMHPHQQPPFQFVQPANPNQQQHHYPPFAHSHQMILQQQMFGMGTTGGFGYPSTSSSSSPFFSHSHPPNQQFLAANSFQEYQQQMMAATPYFMYQMAAQQQQQFGANRPMTTKYPPIMSDPTNWNCEQLAEWVGQCGQMEMANRLRNEEVDGSSFLLFNVETFRQQMRMTLGPAVKMNDLVETMKSSVPNFSPQQPGTSNTGGGQL